MPDGDFIDQPFIYSVQAYRKAGWLGTIPLPPGKKNPPPTGFTGSRAKDPSVDQIKEWCDPTSDSFVDNGNVAQHLGEVEVPSWDRLPVVYAGHQVLGWELIGIDVDTYKEKNGATQLLGLERAYGALPATIRSSSRWESGSNSYIAVFLVPKGFRYIGKADTCIEVVQKRHRYMVAWPSTNPDAGNAMYRWKGPDDQWLEVPPLSMVAVLPEDWWRFLSNNGLTESEDPISDLSGGELLDWARETFQDSEGAMCDHMASTLKKWIDETNAAESSHPLLVPANWEILRSGAEGHAGWLTALKKYNGTWLRSAGGKRDASEGHNEEINRSVIGALSKIEPSFRGLPDDPCAIKDQVASGAYNDRISNFDAGFTEICGCGNPDCSGCVVGERVATYDSGGLGPIAGNIAVVGGNLVSSYDKNDYGNGRHFIDLYGDNVKYITQRCHWVVWTEPHDGVMGRWHDDMENRYVSSAFGRVKQRVAEYAHDLSVIAAADPKNATARANAKSWFNWAKICGEEGRIRTSLQAAHRMYVDDDHPVFMKGTEFDANPILLGCANGLLELGRTPDLREAKRDDFVTRNTTVEYIPWRELVNGEGDRFEGYQLWMEYLDRFLPDPEIRHFVHKVLGYSLIGGNPEKLLIFLYGPRNSGKSTMLTAIEAALGEYYGDFNINLFKSKDFNPQLMGLVPRRVIGMSEVDSGIMDAATIKRLTGNDNVVTEIKHSNEVFKGRPQFTPFIACNNPPDIDGVDNALRNRILVLPFSVSLDGTEVKEERQAQIERSSGITVLSWLVEGFSLYKQEGIGRAQWPSAVAKLQGQVVADFNPTQTFISSVLQKADDCDEGLAAHSAAIDKARSKNRITRTTPTDWAMEWTPVAQDVYATYVRWCQNFGHNKPINLNSFTKELGLGKPEARHVNGKAQKCYVGVRIRNAEA